METNTLSGPAVEPKETKTDLNLLRELAELQQWQCRIDALIRFLKEHHEKLEGLRWSANPWDTEITVDTVVSHADPVLIAKRFPGEWQQNVPSGFSRHDRRDWVAERGGVTIRIDGADRIEPAPPATPRKATF